ncbi:alpha/beta hydrolase [Arenibacter sp. 6A1]|uniref:alpha/beta hydrolase n=1 Tax=Arenibacter sp. 6A1 TaxID=2720391 RepID=UPI001446E47C|nr:alpha/beta hydrolase [Arenibacter sp. 6A1]NKI27245.1 alpha/beta hydrolase [Arenibacter sp. 6A1]
MSQNKIHIYFMPGMAANASIFEHIRLPEELFELHFLEWKIPNKNESLEDYAIRMNSSVKHSNAVLVGVSFGGMLVQEMAKHIEVKKVIIISSVKLASELPRRMVFAKYTKLHKLLPTGMVNNVELMAKYAFGETATKRLKLYQQYLSVRDKYYLDWSIDQIVNWKQGGYDEKVVHIHGEKDPVFPIAYIRDCVKVKNGTHTMIIHRAKWFNEHLPEIILQ